MTTQRGTAQVAHVVGARPNFIKAAPVWRALAKRGIAQELIHTGQHYDREMSTVFFEELGLPEPSRNLSVGSGTHAGQTAALLVALEDAFQEDPPHVVIVYGDVNSTMAGALVCAKLSIPFAHVEAGLRSFDRSMPEEINRVVTDALASVHYVTSPEGMAHLANEGIDPDTMFFVGNPMIDTLVAFKSRFDPMAQRKALDLEGPYGVVTLHRPSNVDDPETASRVVDALKKVSQLVPLVVPLHPRGRPLLERAGLLEGDGLMVTEPLGYFDFMSLLSGASIVLTDSGGIQEETTYLGIPCLTIRPNTERPITISHGTNRLVDGGDPGSVADLAQEALTETPSEVRPPLWDGFAGQRIADSLIDFFALEPNDRKSSKA